MRKRILVSGSAGFIFSNFIRRIVYQKHPYELYSVDKIAHSSMLNNIYQHKLHEFFIADICDAHIIDKIFEYVRPEIVVHGAAESAVDKSIHDPNIFINSNVLGTQILVNASIKYGVEKFLYISTDEVYGALQSSNDIKWTENSPLNPLNPYSASKAAGELIVKAAGNTHKLPWVITRSCNNYGPRQTPDKLIPRIIRQIIKNEKIPVYGEGLQIRDWIHVQDNCDAILKILSADKTNEIFNISANQELANIEVVKTICNYMKTDHVSAVEFVSDRKGHDFRYGVDSGKLRQLGWAPVYKFVDGIKSTIDWFTDNRYVLLS